VLYGSTSKVLVATVLDFEVANCDLKTDHSAAVSWNMKSSGTANITLDACTSALVVTP